MGPGRQACSGTRRELRAEERRQGLGVQSPQGRQVLERAGVHRRRRGLLAQPPSRRNQVRRRGVDEAGDRRQEAGQIPDSAVPRRGRRRSALFPDRLSPPHGPGWFQGLGETGRDRRVHPREVRSGRSHRAEKAPGLLEGGPRLARRGGRHRHQRRFGPPQRADFGPGRRDQPRRPQSRRIAFQGAKDRSGPRVRGAGTP